METVLNADAFEFLLCNYKSGEQKYWCKLKKTCKVSWSRLKRAIKSKECTGSGYFYQVSEVGVHHESLKSNILMSFHIHCLPGVCIYLSFFSPADATTTWIWIWCFSVSSVGNSRQRCKNTRLLFFFKRSWITCAILPHDLISHWNLTRKLCEERNVAAIWRCGAKMCWAISIPLCCWFLSKSAALGAFSETQMREQGKFLPKT